uniref:Uncharacterized protein n=1 Tax=Arundo donax TaxID=35708 RepID=A0A0A9G8T0_ARUDO
MLNVPTPPGRTCSSASASRSDDATPIAPSQPPPRLASFRGFSELCTPKSYAVTWAECCVSRCWTGDEEPSPVWSERKSCAGFSPSKNCIGTRTGEPRDLWRLPSLPLQQKDGACLDLAAC